MGEELLFIQALKRQGRFVVPKAVVSTSGRRLQRVRGWRVVPTMFHLAKFILVSPSRATMRSMARLGGYGRDTIGPR